MSEMFFSSTIVRRVLGSLLSAHLLMEETEEPFKDLKPSWYNGELLEMARDLGSRLLFAFEGTTTGLPHPRVITRPAFAFDLS
jgi:mannosidase alpha-like ER degradation enhancer 1